MKRVYAVLTWAYFYAATIALMLIAFVLGGTAMVELAGVTRSRDPAAVALDAAGLLIIGFAVMETAKFIADEELFQPHELRSAAESRRSLTKFITIIVIAANLEALVMVFISSRGELSDARFPAILFIATAAALVALGAYQYLSSRIHPADQSERDVE